MGGGSSRAKGFEVSTRKSRKARPDRALHGKHARTAVRSGRLPPKTATAAPKTARISTHSSIEPSWFPQTPEIL